MRLVPWTIVLATVTGIFSGLVHSPEIAFACVFLLGLAWIAERTS